MRVLHSFFPLCAIPLVIISGCVCPPCAAGAAGVPAAPAPGGGSGASAPTAAAGLVWDGDSVGGSAKGWASCDKKPDCKAELGPVPGVGRNGTAGLKFVGEGPGYIGMGWNLFGWYPENASVDVSGQGKLGFWVRVVAPSPDVAPEASAITVSLGDNKKKNSAAAPLSDYDKTSVDGQWHKISVPLTDLTKGDGKELDLKSVWEFRISTWSASPRKFEIYVDDIGFEK